MPAILIVDDSPICREPLAAALQAHGYRAICAGDGGEALAILRQDPPDLILLDIAMPGMDGLTVLNIVRRNPKWKDIPVILLTDQAQREYVQRGAQLHAQGYLLKSRFSLKEFLVRVEDVLQKCTAAAAQAPAPCLAASAVAADDRVTTKPSAKLRTQEGRAPGSPVDSTRELDPVITKANLIKLVNQGLELRPLGPTVYNVVAATGNARCSAEDVFKAVAPDQALSIRLLKLANSAAYSRGRPVESVKEAVQRIGMQGVRDLVTTLEVLDHYGPSLSTHLDPRLFWEHSIACGVIAADLAKTRKARNVEEVFLWGLIHDVGRLIMLEHAPEPYSKVWEAVGDSGLPFEAVEARMMLMDHCDILARALEHWKFPKDFIIPVVSHHLSIHEIKRVGPAHAEAAATIALADRMAHALLIGSSGNEVIYPWDELIEFIGISDDAVAAITAAAPDQIKDLKCTMLASAHEGAWPDYASGVRRQLGVPFHPLCVSARPHADAYRVFCNQLAGDAEAQPPNIGVVKLSHPAEYAALEASFQAQEQAAGASGLPVLLICEKGAPNAGEGWLRSRRFLVLRLPVRVMSFVSAVETLLSCDACPCGPDAGSLPARDTHQTRIAQCTAKD